MFDNVFLIAFPSDCLLRSPKSDCRTARWFYVFHLYLQPVVAVMNRWQMEKHPADEFRTPSSKKWHWHQSEGPQRCTELLHDSTSRIVFPSEWICPHTTCLRLIYYSHMICRITQLIGKYPRLIGGAVGGGELVASPTGVHRQEPFDLPCGGRQPWCEYPTLGTGKAKGCGTSTVDALDVFERQLETKEQQIPLKVFLFVFLLVDHAFQVGVPETNMRFCR